MIWLTLALALISIVLGVTALLRVTKLEKETDVAIRDLRNSLSTLRSAEEARMIREAEADMTQEQREETTLK